MSLLSSIQTTLSAHCPFKKSKPAPVENIAIIGAGLSGLTLALALHQHSIPCTIYEARSAPLNIGGAIMLSPNALRILDHLGVYDRIRAEGYAFDKLYFRSPADQPLDEYAFGGEAEYGYRGMRIYRHVLIRELSAMVGEAGIPVHYHRKFVRVVSETDAHVTWEFEDGTTASAACLVGADGIHSRVRKYLYPELEPKFTNAMGVTAAVPTAQLQVSAAGGYDLPVTIMNKQHGAFVIAPQQRDGSEVLIGRQKRAPELDQEGWKRLMGDKEWCVDFLRQGAADFPEVVQRAVSEISPDTINLWPFYVVPKLDSWSSARGRVVILGDAAHAIPPSAGQGINQAFEDVYTYALIVAKCDRDFVEQALKIWQRGRQERVDKVLALNAQIDKRRMPRPAGQEDAEGDDKPFELGWLYKPDFDEMVNEWLRTSS
ncbi:FAD-dependent oxidoreductase [Aspergillus candidus]|uniref:FAD/NAD(P)-binding domain-containing protein n=1 Tax=Aspergillus candidus TaxID=41067 RepID=A0A2I2FNC8_ASPCN|nr:FAD/NAD(P)-binding domain-containing protein [Aspergillus candidus]PLB42125.1 FAD/NAD(P)-binding domain-containing protein [Aspergillus candidus]